MVERLMLISLVASAAMTGLIWFVQVVHYPLFARVPREGFADYHRRHSVATTAVVMPVMLVELVTAGLMLWLLPWGVANAAQGLLVAGVWLSTFCIQVPQHRRLSAGFDPGTLAGLVRWNVLRVVLWTLRVGVVGAMLVRTGS